MIRQGAKTTLTAVLSLGVGLALGALLREPIASRLVQHREPKEKIGLPPIPPPSRRKACTFYHPHVQALMAVLQAKEQQMMKADGPGTGVEGYRRTWTVKGFASGVLDATNEMIVTFSSEASPKSLTWFVDLHRKTIMDESEWKGWTSPEGEPVAQWPEPPGCLPDPYEKLRKDGK